MTVAESMNATDYKGTPCPGCGRFLVANEKHHHWSRTGPTTVENDPSLTLR